MILRFAYTRPDGGVSIVNAAPKAHLERVFGPLTDELYRALIFEKDIPADATNVIEVPIDWVNPKDTANAIFRSALRMTSGQFHFDMPLARDIWRDKMRRARAPLLAALDVQFMQALERGEATAPIVARKQALRDVTADPAIEAAQTLEQLKQVWPAAIRA